MAGLADLAASALNGLAHAVEGLVAHVMYEGVTTPYLIAGSAGNHPE